MTIASIIRQNDTEIGGLTFECTFKEAAQVEYQITDYAVESGDIMSDHIRRTPAIVTLEVGASDVPYPGVIGQLASTAGGAVSGALPPAASQVVGAGASIYGAFGASDKETATAKLYREFLEMADKREVFELVTTKKLWPSMAVKSVGYAIDKETESALVLIIELKEMRLFTMIDESELIDAPVDVPTDGSETSNMLSPTSDLGSAPTEAIV